MNNRPFSSNWWGSSNYYGGHFNYAYRGHSAGYWWTGATVGAVTGWVAGAAWSQPAYYSYGSGGNVVYENNVVYVDGQEYGSAEQYYDDTMQLAENVPELSDAQAEQIEWLPLGVFALTQDGVNDSNMLLQLTMSTEGYLAGTLYNSSTDLSRPVEGTVDERTQRAAIRFADGANPDALLETGIYNLTENESTALVHFGADQVQTMVLVRLDEPQS